MLTLNTCIDAASQVHGILVLPWDRRERCRMRATLASGEDVALFLPRGAPLRHGDLLRGDDGRVVRIVAAPEATYAVRCPTPLVLARCAYGLGSRHVPLQVFAWGLRMRADPVLAARIAQHRREGSGRSAGRSHIFSVSNGHGGGRQHHSLPPGGAKVVHLDAVRPGRAVPLVPSSQPHRPAWTPRHWIALGAALVVGAVGGALGWQELRPDAGLVVLEVSDGALVARGRLVDALGGQLASHDPQEIRDVAWVTLADLQGPIRRALLADVRPLFRYRVRLTDEAVACLARNCPG